MPRGTVPERYRDILTSRAVGHLATIGPDARPQVNPVWFISDGVHVYLSVKADTRKYQNLRASPAVAMSVVDPANSGRYVEVRGDVVDLELFDTLEWVNQLARKYTGRDFSEGSAGEHRYKVTIRVDAWTGQG
ncbi:MAG TPA: PPOX class F420-dependent oxidoreductase [Thermomicrobiaceae bacterium]|nr:PPOX class F420-dependent oxidoreductase [Thermomicrobiaceae bacterium]